MIDNILILSPTLRAGKMNYSEGEAGRGGQLILYKLHYKWKKEVNLGLSNINSEYLLWVKTHEVS